MNPTWNDFIIACRDRYGVATPERAASAGVTASTFYRRTANEAWDAPHQGVRVAPWVRPSTLTNLSTLIEIAGHGALASGDTALWLHALTGPPRHLEVVIPHGRRAPTVTMGTIHRSRWIGDDDRAMIKSLPVLALPAAIITVADRDQIALRALVIDALHKRSTTLPALVERLSSVGPVRGRLTLTRILFELADRDVESIFHDLVLDELDLRGYRPSRRPLLIPTPDGQGARPDIPLPVWRIAIETQGDRFHSTRAQRAADRRKSSQYAGSAWVPLELDWWEWTGNRNHFFEALDAAILAQVRRGIGADQPLPPHLASQRPVLPPVLPPALPYQPPA